MRIPVYAPRCLRCWASWPSILRAGPGGPRKLRRNGKTRSLFPGGPWQIPTCREGGAPQRGAVAPPQNRPLTVMSLSACPPIGQDRPSGAPPETTRSGLSRTVVSEEQVAHWAIGTRLHNRLCTPPTAYCVGARGTESTQQFKSVFAHHGHGPTGGRDLISHPSPGRPGKPKGAAARPPQPRSPAPAPAPAPVCPIIYSASPPQPAQFLTKQLHFTLTEQLLVIFCVIIVCAASPAGQSSLPLPP